jgi:hypothetical protein
MVQLLLWLLVAVVVFMLVLVLLGGAWHVLVPRRCFRYRRRRPTRCGLPWLLLLLLRRRL